MFTRTDMRMHEPIWTINVQLGGVSAAGEHGATM